MATIVGSAASNVSKSSRSDSTQVTFPAIAGAASGDTAYLFHSCDGSLGSSVPSGWTQIDLDNGTSTDWLVASRVITGDSDYTSLDAGFDPGQGWTSIILLVRGSHTLEAFADDNDGDAIAYVYQITGFNSGDLSVIRGTADDQQVTMTPPTGWTLFANDDGTDGSNLSSAGLAYKVSAGGTEGQLAPGNGDEWSGPSSDGSSSFHMRFSGIDDPDAGGEDALLANDVESASEVTTPSIGQEHSLAANDVEAASEVSVPTLAEVASEVDLLANDVEAASEVSAPTIGQEHALAANDVEAASEVTAPALGQEHALAADDVESASEVTAPVIGQVHALTAVNVEAASEVTAPAIGQEHNLSADDVESASEVTAPALGTDGTDALSADDVEAASEVTVPALGQVHVLAANDIEAPSEVTAPRLVIVGQQEAAPAGNPGLGAVLDTTEADKRQRREEQRKRTSDEERRAAVERAFDQLEPKDAPEVVTEALPRRVKREVAKVALTDLRALDDMSAQLGALMALVDEVWQARLREIEQEDDDEVLLLLIA